MKRSEYTADEAMISFTTNMVDRYFRNADKDKMRSLAATLGKRVQQDYTARVNPDDEASLQFLVGERHKIAHGSGQSMVNLEDAITHVARAKQSLLELRRAILGGRQ